MARGIYEIKLKDSLFPAVSADEAIEMWNNGNSKSANTEELEVKMIVTEEDTVKLFLLTKTMYDTDKFNCEEVAVAVSAVAAEMGYTNTEEISNCVIKWVERFEDSTLGELEEWVIG